MSEVVAPLNSIMVLKYLKWYLETGSSQNQKSIITKIKNMTKNIKMRLEVQKKMKKISRTKRGD